MCVQDYLRVSFHLPEEMSKSLQTKTFREEVLKRDTLDRCDQKDLRVDVEDLRPTDVRDKPYRKDKSPGF